MNKNTLCNNCGKQGHQFHQCKQPITSYGIILFRSSMKGIQYLMIRRKDSFGYIDFLRGKYVQNNIDHLQTIFNEMSIFEREKIKNIDFENLWKNMWGIQTEWEFPKGRRNYQEKDLDCALREFEEETGLSKKELKVIENVMPFEEIFIGSNHKSYKHKYFLAYTDNTTDDLTNYQQTEVSKLDWKTLDECLESIRPYNLEKIQLIKNINIILQEYRLY